MSHTSAESVTKTGAAAEESTEQFFTLWTVFKRSADVLRSGDAAEDFEALLGRLAGDGVVHRGSYDVSAMRADADIMIWLHGPKAEALQRAVRDIRRSKLFTGTERQNSPRTTPRPSRAAWNRRSGCVSTRLSAPTSGTCCPTPSAARCSATTACWAATSRRSSPTPFPPSPSATGNGSWASRPRNSLTWWT